MLYLNVSKFLEDRSGQTVLTQRSSLTRVYTASPAASFGCITKAKLSCSTFRVITANFWGVRNLRIFTVCEIWRESFENVDKALTDNRCLPIL